jgi:hypothetical protein
MAKNNGNLYLNRFSGMIGDQMVLRKGKDGRTIMGAKPTYSENRTYSQAQLIQQQAFREAIEYAKAKRGDEIYITKADGTDMSPYNVAVADWFRKPKFHEIDLTGWKGGEPGVIRVNATDDVLVTGVTVRISDEAGFLLEEGQATNVGAAWWEYPTSGELTGKMTLTLWAKDLPGHVTEYSQVRTISAP